MKFKLEELTVWSSSKAALRTSRISRTSMIQPLNKRLVEAVRNASNKTAKQVSEETCVSLATVYKYNRLYSGAIDVIAR